MDRRVVEQREGQMMVAWKEERMGGYRRERRNGGWIEEVKNR